MLEVVRIMRDHGWETAVAVAQGPDLGVSSGSSACSEQQYRGSVKDREEFENESVRRFSQHRANPMKVEHPWFHCKSLIYKWSDLPANQL